MMLSQNLTYPLLVEVAFKFLPLTFRWKFYHVLRELFLGRQTIIIKNDCIWAEIVTNTTRVLKSQGKISTYVINI